MFRWIYTTLLSLGRTRFQSTLPTPCFVLFFLNFHAFVSCSCTLSEKIIPRVCDNFWNLLKFPVGHRYEYSGENSVSPQYCAWKQKKNITKKVKGMCCIFFSDSQKNSFHERTQFFARFSFSVYHFKKFRFFIFSSVFISSCQAFSKNEWGLYFLSQLLLLPRRLLNL